MRIVFCSPEQAAGELSQALYRVRLWNPPEQAIGAWRLDEWDVFDARDVFEVVDWAESQGAATYEIAVAWPSYSEDSHGNRIQRSRYTRIVGESGEGTPTQRVEKFTPAQ